MDHIGTGRRIGHIAVQEDSLDAFLCKKLQNGINPAFVHSHDKYGTGTLQPADFIIVCNNEGAVSVFNDMFFQRGERFDSPAEGNITAVGDDGQYLLHITHIVPGSQHTTRGRFPTTLFAHSRTTARANDVL